MTAKIAVSLPDELVEQARHAVASGAATSVSAYVATAMAAHGRHERLADVLADLDLELGAPSPADRAWARSALGIATRAADTA